MSEILGDVLVLLQQYTEPPRGGEFIQFVQRWHDYSEMEIRDAIWILIGRGQAELTGERTLKAVRHEQDS
jgi:hypothetical protein